MGQFYTAAGMKPKYLEDTGVDTINLHLTLVEEEWGEFRDEVDIFTLGVLNGMVPTNREDIVKELADLQYVLSGFAWRMGINLEAAFNRVHASNMTKVVDGKVIRREDGKILKPATYVAPDMSGL